MFSSLLNKLGFGSSTSSISSNKTNSVVDPVERHFDPVNGNPQKVIWNGHAPYCPRCKKNTVMRRGHSMSTLMYFEPRYVNGKNVNPDRNTISTQWSCEECKNNFYINGNDHDGYKYPSTML